MLSKGCVLLLLFTTVWVVQCTVAVRLRNQTLIAVKKANKKQITLQPKLYVVKPNEIVIGKAKFIGSTNSTGWGFLEIRTSSKASDSDQAYGAGFLEGALTANLIYDHWYNTAKGYCTDRPDVCKNLTDYMATNKKWIESKSNETDPYWYQIGLYYEQLKGLHDGYTRGKSPDTPDLSWDDLFWLNALDDLGDVSAALDPSGTDGKVFGSGSCSALIKLLPGNKDLLVSHVTWSGYETMLRIQKRYSFRFRRSPTNKKLIPGFDMSFSSFPGGVQSGDDFYLMSSGLATLETTNENYNKSLWSNVKPVGQVNGFGTFFLVGPDEKKLARVLEFVRAMIANRLASSPAEWIDTFKMHNSGTYNNQWMIVNYPAFQPGNPLPAEDVLHVLEQMPGTVVHADLTGHLIDRTYWASYNVPFFPFIYNVSGNRDMELRYGEWFSYTGTPRARIFARDHVNVRCDETMSNLMRSNDFRHDPESRCDCDPPYTAENAISARNDLNPANGTYPIPAMSHRSHGATDVKITNSQLFQQLQFKAVAGPTQGTNNTLGPFCWSRSDFNDKVHHLGHPDCFDFGPVLHRWSL